MSLQVSIVGLYLSSLTSLDLSYCPQVSDGGLLSLVLPRDHSGASDPRFGQCRGLTRLLVSGCQTVTSVSCSQLLVGLDKLTVLDFPDTVGVLHSLVMDVTLTPDSRLRLRSLYAGESCSDESLAVAVTLCPQVEHVYIVLADFITPASCLGLLDVDHLRELHLRQDNSHLPDPGLLLEVLPPVLARHGQTLVSLNLAELEVVEVGTLCDNCPSLVHLALLWNKAYTSREGDTSKRECFPKLQTIDLAYANFNEDNFDYVPIEVPTHNLLQILRSPKLKSIKMCASRNLTSECMANVLSFNDLDQLEFLELNKCHEISFESLENLLEEENKLNHVRVLKCDQITRRDIQFYQKKCKKWKWNVNIEWT